MKKNKIEHFIFWEKTLDEATKLLDITQEYFTYRGKAERENFYGTTRLVYSMVMTNIVVKLTSSLSWLMAMRAVNKGFITYEELETDRLSLNKIDENILDDKKLYGYLPKVIIALAYESSALYERVKRMEEMLLVSKSNISSDDIKSGHSLRLLSEFKT